MNEILVPALVILLIAATLAIATFIIATVAGTGYGLIDSMLEALRPTWRIFVASLLVLAVLAVALWLFVTLVHS